MDQQQMGQRDRAYLRDWLHGPKAASERYSNPSLERQYNIEDNNRRDPDGRSRAKRCEKSKKRRVCGAGDIGGAVERAHTVLGIIGESD